MNEYTIKITLTGVMVFDGLLPKSRRKYYAPGLQINVLGACPVKMRDKVHYHAMSLARAHHIPLTQLTSEGWV